MMKRELEERVGFILAWGALAVSILVTDRINSDPVNVSKMLLLSVIGFSLLPVLFVQRDQLLKDSRVLFFASLGFITVATGSIFTSANPIERDCLRGIFAGTNGRSGDASHANTRNTIENNDIRRMLISVCAIRVKALMALRCLYA
jgi:hypothetical protein